MHTAQTMLCSFQRMIPGRNSVMPSSASSIAKVMPAKLTVYSRPCSRAPVACRGAAGAFSRRNVRTRGVHGLARRPGVRSTSCHRCGAWSGWQPCSTQITVMLSDRHVAPLACVKRVYLFAACPRPDPGADLQASSTAALCSMRWQDCHSPPSGGQSAPWSQCRHGLLAASCRRTPRAAQVANDQLRPCSGTPDRVGMRVTVLAWAPGGILSAYPSSYLSGPAAASGWAVINAVGALVGGTCCDAPHSGEPQT